MKLLKNRLIALETKLVNNTPPPPYKVTFGQKQEHEGEHFVRFIKADGSKPLPKNEMRKA